jgi:hypothetical protein
MICEKDDINVSIEGKGKEDRRKGERKGVEGKALGTARIKS